MKKRKHHLEVVVNGETIHTLRAGSEKELIALRRGLYRVLVRKLKRRVTLKRISA